MKLTVEQRLQRAHLHVVNHIKHCAVGGVVMFGRTSVVDDFPTACTDGFNTQYGRGFIETLDEPELRFLVLHENYHKAFRHLSTWRHIYKENPKVANMACDYVINLRLQDLDGGEGFIKMPKLGLIDEKYRGMDEGQVFRELLKSGEDGSGGDGFDEHDWEGEESLSDAERKEIASKIDEALRQGAILAGKKGGQMDRALSGLLEPKINWREALREFVTTQCSGRDMSTWRKVNRRFVSSGMYLPGHISESVGRVLVGVDTSGSVGAEELRDFLSEVSGIAKQVSPELLDLVYWDSSVAAHEKYATHELDGLMSSTRPKGGGGTAPSCVTSHMREHNIKPECAIILTDGYVGSDWGGQWPCPVLWVIVGGNNVMAPVGKTVHI
jgi:predicted metal-dependent peptidase